jgi:hypothetical protein
VNPFANICPQRIHSETIALDFTPIDPERLLMTLGCATPETAPGPAGMASGQPSARSAVADHAGFGQRGGINWAASWPLLAKTLSTVRCAAGQSFTPGRSGVFPPRERSTLIGKPESSTGRGLGGRGFPARHGSALNENQHRSATPTSTMVPVIGRGSNLAKSRENAKLPIVTLGVANL